MINLKVGAPLLTAILTLSTPNLVSPSGNINFLFKHAYITLNFKHILIFFILILIDTVSIAQPMARGAALFQKACIGCHDMGGNIIQPVIFLILLIRNYKQYLQTSIYSNVTIVYLDTSQLIKLLTLFVSFFRVPLFSQTIYKGNASEISFFRNTGRKQIMTEPII